MSSSTAGRATGVEVHTRYCPDCRKTFTAETASPPYAAMTILADGEVTHVDPITHAELSVVIVEEDS